MPQSSANWPVLNYPEFKETAFLLHMGTQIIGKLKLNTPFEPHWANVPFWLSARGFTTGLIPYQSQFFSVDFDLLDHEVVFKTSTGAIKRFKLTSMSVADFANKVFASLSDIGIDITINPMPQEIANPINFFEDKSIREYRATLATAWWQILLSTYRVMEKYHARFNGETPSIGLMWGTFDLRDARYNGRAVKTTGINAGYIRRNAMNEEQVEIGFWPGNEGYPQAAYFSFTYPQPQGIEKTSIQPKYARWDTTLSEFILDYDDLRQSAQPDADLLAFFESTYAAGTQLAKWDAKLITAGEPV